MYTGQLAESGLGPWRQGLPNHAARYTREDTCLALEALQVSRYSILREVSVNLFIIEMRQRTPFVPAFQRRIFSFQKNAYSDVFCGAWWLSAPNPRKTFQASESQFGLFGYPPTQPNASEILHKAFIKFGIHSWMYLILDDKESNNIKKTHFVT
jgi:hypothetical protein